MKNFLLLLIPFLLLAKGVSSQQDKEAGKGFGSQISAGVTEGQYGTSFHIETVNGLRYKTWFGGVGTGLDYYYLRSIPLYLSVTKYLGGRNHSFYVQGDGGLNFAWDEQPMNRWNEVSSQFKPGLYWNSALGFATGLDKKNSFLFGVGYSYKYIKEIKEIAVFCINPPCVNSVETYRYGLRRLTLKLGWQFNYSR